MGFSEVFVALSLSALIFSGPLAPYLPQGIGMALFTASVVMVLSALLSSLPGLIASVQDSSTVLLALITAGLAGGLSKAQPEDLLATVLVAIAVSVVYPSFRKNEKPTEWWRQEYRLQNGRG